MLTRRIHNFFFLKSETYVQWLGFCGSLMTYTLNIHLDKDLTFVHPFTGKPFKKKKNIKTDYN